MQPAGPLPAWTTPEITWRDRLLALLVDPSTGQATASGRYIRHYRQDLISDDILDLDFGCEEISVDAPASSADDGGHGVVTVMSRRTRR